jgi:hypothetical protein
MGVTKVSVLIRKSKTDQLAKGRRLNLSQQATEAINLWLEKLRNPKEGQLKELIVVKKLLGR